MGHEINFQTDNSSSTLSLVDQNTTINKQLEVKKSSNLLARINDAVMNYELGPLKGYGVVVVLGVVGLLILKRIFKRR